MKRIIPISALFVACVASADRPALQPALAPFTGFPGKYHCSGSFVKSGKAISSTETFTSELSGYRLMMRHEDEPPFQFDALELWGFDAHKKSFVAHIFDNFGGEREFDSPGWQDNRFVWTNVDTTAKQRDRFVFERNPGTGYRFTYEVSPDGSSWSGVDSLVCTPVT